MKQRHGGARRGSLLGAFSCLCLVPPPGLADGGTVSVAVMDSSGLVVPGARLTLTDPATTTFARA
jgi:hypothetical protein